MRKIKKILIDTNKFLVMVLPLMMIIVPADKLGIAEFILGIIVISGLLVWADVKKKIFHLYYRWIDLIIVVINSIAFFMRWKPSSIVNSIAAMVLLETDSFLLIVSILLSFLTLFSVDLLIFAISNYTSFKRKIKKIFLVMMISMLEYAQLGISASYNLGFSVLSTGISILLLNVLIIFTINLICKILLKKWRRALSVTSAFFTVWGIANYYVIQFYGSPLFASELLNARTALKMVVDYEFTISWIVVAIFLTGLLEIGTVLSSTSKEKSVKLSFKGWGEYIGGVLICCFVITAYFMFPNVFGSSKILSFSWKSSVYEYGFLVCSIEDTKNIIYPYNCPEGYDIDAITIDEDNAKNNKNSEEYPDIILILNETFCDLDVYSEIKADGDYLNDLYSIENLSSGYTVVPTIGGGTNNSEYELLTSKSLYLLNAYAPFNYINFNKSPSSIVQYLKNLGYSTTAMHCGTASNYSRDKAYPALGFDNILLGQEDFMYVGYNGNRKWLDEDNYRDLIAQYESGGDEPRFLYLLTLQNHGGYNQNESADDSVHTTIDLGNLTEQINEYLSSVTLSATGFKSLTEYFSTVDRQVIICMVGDHAPSFISSLPSNQTYSELEKEIRQRMVPYVMWANFDADFSACSEFTSMVDLVPVLLESADLPISTFYQTILELHNTIPIRTSNGICMDSNGEIYQYQYSDSNSSLLTQYYYLEYNSLRGGKGYMEELFLPSGASN